jgi:DNA-binding CsgD family transcriptional regulator
MATSEHLVSGRAAYERSEWAAAHEQLRLADAAAPLAPADLERLATSAYLIGDDEGSVHAWTRAHAEHREDGDLPRAIRCAFWLAFGALHKGQHARGAGWLTRAQGLLEECGGDCVEEGFLLIPAALRFIRAGDPRRAYETFCLAAEIADRFGDPDLAALARHGRGRVLIRLGEVERGVALLDEAMTSVEAGDVSPVIVGEVYCSVIEGCVEIFDLGRAREWTEALSRWCDSQPDLAPYRGQCLVRRAEIMQLRGAWPDALEEAREACERLTRPPGEPAAGAAFYQRGELHRLRGEVGEAEEAYRQASEWGRSPQPGLALLRLAQGRTAAAEAAIRRMEGEARDRAARCRTLPAYVEIMIAVGDLPAARAAAAELSGIAATLEAPYLRAVAAASTGAVLLAEGDARAALPALREAWQIWESLEAPHEAARVRVLIGLACQALGDADSAKLEISAARNVFHKLGATAELTRIDGLSPAPPGHLHGLTSREIEVLRLVAAGETNRSIAARLFISDRTVERHVSNIFTKIHVSSRSAATAFAYEHQLV